LPPVHRAAVVCANPARVGRWDPEEICGAFMYLRVCLPSSR
jgi:hypothetical protein